MVSKAVPVAIGIVVIAAVILAMVFFTSGQVEVGAPFDVAYAECLQGLERVGSFVEAVRTGDVEKCAVLVSSEFCRAVVLKDESRCGTDQTCVAFVTSDVSLCGEGDADCRAFITGDARECDAYSSGEIDVREECRALAGKDVRYFSSRRAQRNCLDSVVMTLATNSTDCAQISNRDVRAQCVERFE